MADIDQLIELTTAQAEIQAGAPLQWVVARHGTGMVCTLDVEPASTPGKPPPWSIEEDEFLAKKLGWLSIEEIAAQLGRTPVAVELRWKRDLGLPGPSKHPDWITGNQVAKILGVDGHSIMKLIDRKLLPGRILPGARTIRVVHQAVLKRWAVNPHHWVYFRGSVADTGRLTDPHLRRLIERQKERWADEWWSAGQVAEYYGVEHADINRYLHAGKLNGVKWGNWWYLRFEATRPGLVFYKGKGAAQAANHWSEDADAFLILAKAVGLSWLAVGCLMNGWRSSKAAYRVRRLHRQGEIPGLIERYGLEVEYDPATGSLFADWRVYRHRFPYLAAAVERFRSGSLRPGPDDLSTVRRLLGAWAARYAANPEMKQLAFRLNHALKASEGYVRKACEQLKSWGIEPLADR